MPLNIDGHIGNSKKRGFQFFETWSEEIEFILSKNKMVASLQSDVGFSRNVTDKKNNSTLTITIYVKGGNI